MKSILNYHGINRRLSPFFSTIPPSIFKKNLLFFKRNLIELIEFKDYFRKEKGVVITFDDGFQSLYNYLPELIEEFNFRPIIFIVTGFIGKKSKWDVWINRENHLNKKEIKYLSEKGVLFGSHTHNHFLLTVLNRNELHYELDYSKKLLEDLTGKEIKYISYPFGKYNDYVLEKAIECGYKNGFVSTPIKFKEGDFNVGRWSVYLIDNFFTLRLKNDEDGFFSKIEKMKCRMINKFSFLTYYVNLFC